MSTPLRDIPLLHEVDVAVVGGGLAGVAAAAAAAAEGAVTLLIEPTDALGQDAFGLPDGLDGFACIEDKPLGGSLQERLAALLGEAARWVDGRLYVCPADLAGACDALLRDAGATAMHNAAVADVSLTGDQVDGLIVAAGGRLGRIAAHCSVDATAAALVATRAGAPYVDANASPTPQPLIVALRATAVNADEYADGGPPALTAGPIRKAHAMADVAIEAIVPPTGEDVEAWIYLSVAPAADVTNPIACSEARRHAFALRRAVAELLVKHVPGFAAARFPDAAPRLSVPDVRRISARVQLNAEHLADGAAWPDGLGLLAPRRPDEPAGWQAPAAIPYRCLVPDQVDGLLVAGGCISATCPSPRALRTALASLVTGQIAGVAAALAARRSLNPRMLSTGQIGRHLTQQGAVVP